MTVTLTNNAANFSTYKLESYEWTGSVTATAADTFVLPDFPAQAGIKIVDIKSYHGGTASSTLSVGDTADATRYISAASTASAGWLADSSFVAPVASSGVPTKGLGYVTSGAEALQLTFGGADISAKVVKVVVTYAYTYPIA